MTATAFPNPANATIQPAADDPRVFESLVQRMVTMCATPIALYGAGEVVQRLCPTAHAPHGSIIGIIDDDPKKVGKVWAGLPVIDAGEALSRGVKSVIITAADTTFTKLWNNRMKFREAGVYVLGFPRAFSTKGWDETLIEQYEYDLAKSRGINVVYQREYPPEKPEAWPSLLNPLLDRFKPGMTVCEIGSGTGLWTQHLIDKAGSYHCVDYAARLLYEAIEHRFARHAVSGKLKLHHDEKATLAGVADNSIDLLYSMDVFVHLKADLVHQYLVQAKRVLKPGAKALIHFVQWNDRALQIWKQTHTPAMEGKYNIMFYCHMDMLRTSARELGLKVEQVGEDIGWAFLAEFTKPA